MADRKSSSRVLPHFDDCKPPSQPTEAAVIVSGALPDGKHRIAAIVRVATAEPGRPAGE
jgi:hypothetical protein